MAVNNLEELKKLLGYDIQKAASGQSGLTGMLSGNQSFQKILMGLKLSKLGVLAGHDYLSNSVAQSLMAGSIGATTFGGGKSSADRATEGILRKQASTQKGYNNSFFDTLAGTSNAVQNAGKIGMSNFMLNHYLNMPTLLNTGMAHNLMYASSPMMAGGGLTHAAGGIENLGTMLQGTAKDPTMFSGMNPIALGVMAMMGTSLASKKLNSFIQEKSSTNKNKLSNRRLRTSATSFSDLTDDAGVNMLQTQLMQIQSMPEAQVSAADALIISALTMIYGSVSASAAVAADIRDSDSKKNKEGFGNANNHLHELFGDTGIHNKDDQYNLKRERTGIEKFSQFAETGSAQLLQTFDIMTQISNTLSGVSSTAVLNDIKEKNDTTLLKAEKEYGIATGLSTIAVQAIHMSPAQLLSSSNSYEDANIRLLGWIGELNKYQVQELVRARNSGKKITSLSDLKDNIDFEENREKYNSTYNMYFKELDNMLGYIPGMTMLTGSGRFAHNATKSIIDYFAGEKQDDGTRGDSKFGEMWENGDFNIKKRFSRWMENGMISDNLMDEDALRSSIGMEEASNHDKMQNYFGETFPDRFELLLKFNHHQAESLAAMVGNISRTEFTELRMHKYTGQMGDKDYHNKANSTIMNNLDNLIENSNDIGRESIGGMLYSMMTGDDNINYHLMKKYRQNNGLLNNLITNGDLTSADSTTDRNYNNQSLQDLQDKQKLEERAENTYTIQEKQLIALNTLVDCFGCEKDSRTSLKSRSNTPGSADNASGGIDGFGISTDPFGTKSKDHGKLTKDKKPKVPIKDKVKGFFSKISKISFKGMWTGLKAAFTLGGMMGMLKTLWKPFGLFLGAMGSVGGAGLAGAGSMILTALPYVAAVAAVGFVAYSAWDYIDGVFSLSDEKKQERLENKHIRDDFKGDKLEETFDNLLKSARAGKNYVKKRLKSQNPTAAELRLLIKKVEDDKSWYWRNDPNAVVLAEAAAELLKEKADGGHVFNGDDIYNAEYGIGTKGYGNDYKTLNDRVKKGIRTSNVESLELELATHKKDMSPEMRHEFEAVIKYKKETAAGAASGKYGTADIIKRNHDLTRYINQSDLKFNQEMRQKIKYNKERKKEKEKEQKEYLEMFREVLKDAAQDGKVDKDEQKKLYKTFLASHSENKKLNTMMLSFISDIGKSNKVNADTVTMVYDKLQKLNEKDNLSERLSKLHKYNYSIKQTDF